MAATDIGSMKKEAAVKMAAGRAEMDRELQRMRVQLSPSRIAHSVMEQHAFAILGTVFAVGLAVPLLLFRRSSASQAADLVSVPSLDENPRRTPKKFSALSSLIGGLTKAATPFLIKQLLKSLEPKPSTSAGSTPTEEWKPGNGGPGAGK